MLFFSHDKYRMCRIELGLWLGRMMIHLTEFTVVQVLHTRRTLIVEHTYITISLHRDLHTLNLTRGAVCPFHIILNGISFNLFLSSTTCFSCCIHSCDMMFGLEGFFLFF